MYMYLMQLFSMYMMLWKRSWKLLPEAKIFTRLLRDNNWIFLVFSL